MKKKLIFLIIFLLFFLGFVHNSYNSETATVFNYLIPSDDKITDSLMNDYLNGTEKIKEKATERIKIIVLKDLDYDNWLDYTQYIEMAIYPIDIDNNLTEDLIISLNITKDLGVVSIYEHIDNNFLYINKIENLTHINDISAFQNNGNFYLSINQTLDERIGAFFIDNYLQVFTIINDSFIEIFRQSIDYKSYFYEKWLEPSLENPNWYKITEQSSIDLTIDENENPKIYITKTISKYLGLNSTNALIPHTFELVEEKHFDLKYYKIEEYNYFIQAKGKIKSTGEIVGIIDSSKQFADSLLNLYNPYYKIIDKNDKIRYIDSNNVTIINNSYSR